jgi:hypothetical protein
MTDLAALAHILGLDIRTAPVPTPAATSERVIVPRDCDREGVATGIALALLARSPGRHTHADAVRLARCLSKF